jgi:hypothetical protein
MMMRQMQKEAKVEKFIGLIMNAPFVKNVAQKIFKLMEKRKNL